MVNFYNYLFMHVDHIDNIRKVAEVKHVNIGSDFHGIG